MPRADVARNHPTYNSDIVSYGGDSTLLPGEGAEPELDFVNRDRVSTPTRPRVDNIFHVKSQLGHSCIASTMVYCASNPKLSSKAAHEALSQAFANLRTEPSMNKQVRVTVRFVAANEYNGARITTYKDRVGLVGAQYFTDVAATPTFSSEQKACEYAKSVLDSVAVKK
jgi:hypothetical protein